MEIEKLNKLYELCLNFIHDHDISCAEAVHQTDSVIEDAYEFIENICNIVGYVECEEDDE